MSADPFPGKVLVTPRSFARDDDELRQALAASVREVKWEQGGGLDSARLRKLVAEADGWIAGIEPIDRSVLERAKRLKVIARYGTGVDNVDLSAAAERGIVVTNTPGVNAGSVAELVIGLLFALARSIPYADRRVRGGIWAPMHGVALQDKVVGLLGFGAIGREVAWRARALGCQVRAHDPAPAELFAQAHGVELTCREQILAGSDFLSLHVPVLPETRGMVDAAFLAGMQPGAFLINAARGELVDERALIDALRTGHLGGAALDALSEEPPRPNFELAKFDNVVITPHIGAHTDRAVRAMGWGAMNNCLAVLGGRNALNPVVPPTPRSSA